MTPPCAPSMPALASSASTSSTSTCCTFPNPTDWANTIASYRAAEQLLADGRVRAIGVCNVKPEHLDALLSDVDTVPAVNQIELHPFFAQPAMRAKNAELGITTQAWSPIGGVRMNYAAVAEDQQPLNSPVLREIGERHGKSTAQVILRWHLQHGISAIPKSVHPERIKENFDEHDDHQGVIACRSLARASTR
jgi:2,5-diketo-D-gluconate reductase A